MLPGIVPWLIVGLGLLFGFLNGVNDSGSLAAAIIGSGAAGPRQALLLTAAAQLLGALGAGVAVARTMAAGIVDPQTITTPVVVATLLGAIGWNILTWYLALPSSTSHALVGALVGAVWLQAGAHAILGSGLGMVLLALFISPWIGFAASYGLMKLLLFLLQGATPRMGLRLKRLQLLLAPLLAVGHGANDAQKTMGIVALGLLSLHVLPSFYIPRWLQLAAALALATGTSVGGLRIVRTLGLKLYHMRDIHSVTAQAASALVVLAASLLGGPVSTTQVMGASIAGAGSAQRFSQVRWQVIGNIVVAWLLTIPAAAALGAALCWALGRLL